MVIVTPVSKYLPDEFPDLLTKKIKCIYIYIFFYEPNQNQTTKQTNKSTTTNQKKKKIYSL